MFRVLSKNSSHKKNSNCRDSKYSASRFQTPSAFIIKNSYFCSEKIIGMELNKIVKSLQEYSPLKLAGSWDNVGLLAEPSKPQKIQNVMLTIDLTETVLEEAIAAKANMIISYHPPVFSAMKKFTTASREGRVLLRAIEEKIAIFSPHSALDAILGGINDWVLEGVLGNNGNFQCLTPHKQDDGLVKIVVFVPHSVDIVDFISQLSTIQGCGQIGNYTKCSFSIDGTGSFYGSDESNPTVGKKGQFETVQEKRLEMLCPRNQLGEVTKMIKKIHPYETPAFDVYPQETVVTKDGPGEGRIVKLKEKLPLVDVIERVKKHLNLTILRLAIPSTYNSKEEVTIGSIAVCVGSGAGVLKGVRADLYLSGEMSHHDILAAVASGATVLLTEHTNCERGYLQVYKKALDKMFDNQLQISISNKDKDPIQFC